MMAVMKTDLDETELTMIVDALETHIAKMASAHHTDIQMQPFVTLSCKVESQLAEIMHGKKDVIHRSF